MKNTQSKIEPVKIGKHSGIAYCFGCKDYAKKFRSEKVNWQIKYLEKNLIVLLVNLINKDFYNKK